MKILGINDLFFTRYHYLGESGTDAVRSMTTCQVLVTFSCNVQKILNLHHELTICKLFFCDGVHQFPNIVKPFRIWRKRQLNFFRQRHALKMIFHQKYVFKVLSLYYVKSQYENKRKTSYKVCIRLFM